MDYFNMQIDFAGMDSIPSSSVNTSPFRVRYPRIAISESAVSDNAIEIASSEVLYTIPIVLSSYVFVIAA